MAYDWRNDPVWTSLSPQQKWAAMAIMEAGMKKPDQARNVAHAIYNRATLLGDPIDKHIETKKGKRYGWYQPLYEANQRQRLPGILKSQAFRDMVEYVGGVERGEIPDTTGGATRYLVPPKKMYNLSGGVRMTKDGWRGNSSKYYSWPKWTGFDPGTMSYKGETKQDGVHAFLIPDEDVRIAKTRGINLEEIRMAALEKNKEVKTDSGKKLAAELYGSVVQAGYSPGSSGNQAPEPDSDAYKNLWLKHGGDQEKMQADQGQPQPEAQPEAQPESVDEFSQEPDGPEPNTKTVPQFNPNDYDENDPSLAVKDGEDVQPSDHFVPNNPTSYEDHLKAHNEKYGSEDKDVSWADAWDATWGTTPSIQLGDEIIRRSDPIFGYKQEGFNVTTDDLLPYPEEQWGYLMEAPNSVALDILKKELDDRNEAYETWANTSSAQYWTLGTLSIGADVALGYSLGIPFGSAARGIAATRGINPSSALGRAVTIAADAGFGTGVEMAGHVKSGMMTPEQAYFWTSAGFIGGAALGTLGARFGRAADETAERALREATEDAIEEMAEKTGKKLPQERDARADIEDLGEPSRIKIDDTKSPLVYREDTPATRQAAEKFVDDAGVLDEAFVAVRQNSDNAGPAVQKANEAFERQAYLLDAPKTVYFRVREGVDIGDIIRGKVAIAYENIESAISKARMEADPHVVVKLTLPKSARVIEGGKFDGVGVKGEVFFGDGAVTQRRISSGTRKGELTESKEMTLGKGDDAFSVPLVSASFKTAREGKTKAVPQFAYAIDKATQKPLSPNQMRNLSEELFTHGMDAPTFTRGSSAGAARVNPDKYRVHDPEKAVRDVLARETDIEREHWSFFGKSLPWSLSRIQLLLNSDNPLVRAVAPQLMGGAQDMSERMLKKGLIRPRAVDAIRERLRKAAQTKILKADEKHFKEYRKARREANMPRMSEFDELEQFRKEVTEYRRILDSDGFVNKPFTKGVAEMSSVLDEFFRDWANRLKNPRMETGLPGDKAVGGLEDMPTRNGYTPRVFSGRNIDKVEEAFGPRTLNEYLYRSMLSKMHSESKVSDIRGAERPPGVFTPGEIRKMADAMANKIKMNRGGWNQSFEAALGHADPEDLIAIIRKADISDDAFNELQRYIRVTSTTTDKANAGSRTHYRALLDEKFEMELPRANGQLEKIKLSHFTETNATALALDYATSMSGRVALANLRVVLPGKAGKTVTAVGPDGIKRTITEPGVAERVLVDGIYSDRDWEKLMKAMAETSVEKYGRTSKSQMVAAFEDKAILDNYYQYMTNTYPDSTPRLLMFMKMLSTAISMGGAGFAQLGETINGVAYGGASAVARLGSVRQISHVIRKGIAKAKGDNTLDEFMSPLTRILHDDMGIGTEMARMRNASYLEDLNTNFMSSDGAGFIHKLGQRLYHNTEKAQNFVLKTGGLAPSTAWSTIRIAESLNDVLLKQSLKYADVNAMPRRLRERWAQAGLTLDELDKAMRMYRNPKIVVQREGSMFKQVEDVRLDAAGFDEALFDKVQDAIIFMSTRAIQENKWAALPPGFDNPYIKMIFQFRSFMIGSFQSQLMNNGRNLARQIKRAGKEGLQGNMSMTDGAGDAMMGALHEGAKIFPQMITGVLMLYALNEIKNLGETEDEHAERMEKFWDPKNLAMAAVSRSGVFSSVPFMFDSTYGQFFGNGTSFNGYRSSGFTEDIFGAPVLGIPAKIKRAGNSAWDFYEGEGDQNDLRNLSRAITNLWYIDGIINYTGRRLLDLEKGRDYSPRTALGGLVEFKEKD